MKQPTVNHSTPQNWLEVILFCIAGLVLWMFGKIGFYLLLCLMYPFAVIWAWLKKLIGGKS